tara:strand:- start:396 stop:704 length:309 start_codon:yes stop_codon:yes gene_type:complete
MSDDETQSKKNEDSGDHVYPGFKFSVRTEGIKIFHLVQNWRAGEGISRFHALPVSLNVFTEDGVLFAKVDFSEKDSCNKISHGVLVTYKEPSSIGKIVVYFI